MFETEQEKPQAKHHIERSGQNLPQIGNPLAQHAKLEAEQDCRDWRDVAQCRQQGPAQFGKKGQAHALAHAPTTIPKTRTKMMGIRLAKAIRPRRDQRNGDGRGRHPAAVIGDADDFRRRDRRQPDDEDIAADDQPLHRPAFENSENADHQRDADRDRDRVAQRLRITRLAGRARINGASRGHDVRGFAADRDQRRFGDRGAKAQREREQQQPKQRSLAHERIRQRLADREQRHLQAADKDRQSEQDEHEPDGDLAQIIDRDLAAWMN